MIEQKVGEGEDFNPEWRTEILKEIRHFDPNGLAALAFARHNEMAIQKESNAEYYKELQRVKSEEFAARFEGQYQQGINGELSRILGEDHTTPAIRNLVWRMDRENLEKLTFNVSSGMQGVQSGNMRHASLFAHVVEGLWIETALWGNRTIVPPIEQPRHIQFSFYITTDVHDPSVAEPLKNMDQLGAAVGKAVEKVITR